MGNYYRDYTIVKEFLRREDRAVYLARTNIMIPGYPIEFIIKQFIGGEPREAEIHKQLQNSYSHILKVFDTWTDAHYYYMCIEYCEDGDLHTYLQLLNGQPLGFQYILHISLQLSTTVSIMHQMCICHRDIKPLNIYLSNNRQSYKLADFGESKKVNNNELSYHTIIGTPLYMSPEQQKNYENKLNMQVNPYRDDIWALGKTFIEISFGRLCPETHSMNLKDLHRLIDEKFNFFGYPARFCVLVKNMMVELKDFKLDAQKVRNEIWDLYNELYVYNYNAVRVSDEGNSAGAVNEVSAGGSAGGAVNEVSAGGNSGGVVNKNVEVSEITSGIGFKFKEETHQITSNLGNVIVEEPVMESNFSDSELSSSFSSSEEYNSINDEIKNPIPPKLPLPTGPPMLKLSPQENFVIKPQVNIPNPQPALLHTPPNIVNNSKPPVVKPPVGKPPSAIQESPIKNHNLKVQEIKSTGKISIVTERSRDPEEKKFDYESQFKIEELPQQKINQIVPTPPPVKENSPKPAKLGNIESQQKLDSPSLNIPRLQLPDLNTCVICNNSDSKEKITLNCKHIYHKSCFLSSFKNKIIKLTKRSPPLKCHGTECKVEVEFSFLDRMNWEDKKISQIVSLQVFSNTKFSCPNCKQIMKSNMLSRKFKAKTKRCPDCKSKFCTFCGVRGSHRFYCDLLKEYKDGKHDQQKYTRTNY